MIRVSLTLALWLLSAPALMAEPAPGARLFAENCAVCHGAEGTGDGPMAEVLSVPPADLTLIAARNGGSLPRLATARRIDGRDPILTHGGEMPIFGFIFSEFDTVLRARGGQTLLTSAQVVDLVDYLESIQQ